MLPKMIPSRKQLAKVRSLILVIAFFGIGIVTVRSLVYVYAHYINGGELVKVNSLREKQLSDIWKALQTFHAAKNRYPQDMDDWLKCVPAACEYLARPYRAEHGYSVDFNLLGHSGEVLVISDPGIQIPGIDFGEYKPSDDRYYSDFRLGLFSNGVIRSYGPRDEIEAQRAASTPSGH
jgi:hypothetical protein